MTKIVRQVARKDALKELADDLIHHAFWSRHSINDFMDREKRNRERRDFFGRKALFDDILDANREKIESDLREFEEKYRLYNSILMSHDEFVFMTDD